MKEKTKRAYILLSRVEELTQKQIAEKLGVSRQRIQQLEKKYQMPPRRDPLNPIRHSITCKKCSKVFLSTNKHRVYCSRDCFIKAQKERWSPEEIIERMKRKKESNKIRAKKYYHEVFKKKKDWQKIVKMRNNLKK